jgi:sporulation protein YlmC with PRC-barrel domain
MTADQRALLSASMLAGDRVLDRAGENLGKIEDFMLDMESGRVAYAVLSVGGVLGIGDKLIAVPPEALTLDRERDCFIIDADRSDLEQAPTFDRNSWPDVTDASFTDRVYAHYGRKSDRS